MFAESINRLRRQALGYSEDVNHYDEFELAGFNEEECKGLWEIVEKTGIEPSRLIQAVRGLLDIPN